jgi:hypothetical protein
MVEPLDGLFDGGDVLRVVPHGDGAELQVDGDARPLEAAAQKLDGVGQVGGIAVLHVEDLALEGVVLVEVLLLLLFVAQEGEGQQEDGEDDAEFLHGVSPIGIQSDSRSR